MEGKVEGEDNGDSNGCRQDGPHHPVTRPVFFTHNPGLANARTAEGPSSCDEALFLTPPGPTATYSL